MLKQTVTYTNFNDDQVTEVLRFNISKTELMDNLELKDDLERMSEGFSGPERDLSTEEIKEVLGVIKTFMQLSYGVLSPDGRRFQKSPELWTEFTQTAAYDAYLMSLFENGGERAIAFMVNIIPSDLREEVNNAMANDKKLSNEQITAMVNQANSRLTVAGSDAPVIKDETATRELIPTAPVLEEDQDVEALLAQMPGTEAPPANNMTPITRQQAAFLKEKLSKDQYDRHMAGKYFVD